MGTLGRAIYTVGFWIRETGQAIDRLGCRLQGTYHFQEQLSRHRTLMNVFDKAPVVDKEAFVAPSASIIGDVQVGRGSSIWYGCVLRGDVNNINIGSGTNIQDNSLVHVAKSNLAGKVLPTIIGDNVTVGHSAVLHGCTVENEAFVGMGATLLDGVFVEKHAMVAAGALVRQNTRIPCGEVAIEELENILSEVKTRFLPSITDLDPMKTIAGGSVANTIRGLASGFGIKCGIIGACGNDEQGQLFVHNMTYNDVNLSRLTMKTGPTAQCVCLVDSLGNRTMRPCLSNAVRLQADELTRETFRGSKWLVLRYGIYNLDIIHAAITIAKQEGVSVSLDLASFEMVRDFRAPLLKLLESGDVDLCFANEDEATEVVRGNSDTDPEAALGYLAKHCQWAVVTLGSSGCIAKYGKEIVRVAAIGDGKASDATGAGDLFASGFLYGLVKGLSLEDCCVMGCCSGGSVIRSLGGEVSPENRQWMYKQMQNKGLPIPDLCN